MTSVRRHVRGVLDLVAHRSGLGRLLERSMRRGVTVLTYHRVLPADRCAGYPFPALAMPEEAFAAQVAWLAERCEVVTVGEAVRLLGQAGEAPRRARVCVTFDDGYDDGHDIAAPILAAHGVCATFFVTAGLAGTKRLTWLDRAALLRPRGADPAQLKLLPPAERDAELDRLEDGDPVRDPAGHYRIMTGAQIRALSAQGHEIGSHSLTHPILTGLSDDALAMELSGSRRLLEEITGRPVEGFCYPNGDHDDRVVEAVRRAGYSWACTAAGGRNGPATPQHRLRRIDVTARAVCSSSGAWDVAAFRAQVNRLHEVFR